MPCSRSARRPSVSRAKSNSPCAKPRSAQLRATCSSLSARIGLRVVQQPADQRRLAVVDGAGGGEAEQRAPPTARWAGESSEVPVLLAVFHGGLGECGRRRGWRRARSAGWRRPRRRRRRRWRRPIAPRRCRTCRRRCGSAPCASRRPRPSRGGGDRADGTPHAVARVHLALVGEVERGQRDLLALDVAPDVQLGPVARSGTRARAGPAGGGRCRGSTARGAGCADPTGRTRRAAR